MPRPGRNPNSAPEPQRHGPLPPMSLMPGAGAKRFQELTFVPRLLGSGG